MVIITLLIFLFFITLSFTINLINLSEERGFEK